MPKVYITKQEKLNNQMLSWLIGEMKVQKISQEDVAHAMGISRQALNQKINKTSFKYPDLVLLFDLLGADATKVAELMGVNECTRK